MRVATTWFLALLRGINVGGRNRVAMADLRAAFQASGYESVATYIQSGNVMFRADAPAASLESDIETVLEARLGVPAVVVVRSHRELRAVVNSAPEGFGATPETYYSDVMFLKAPLTSDEAMRAVELREGVDKAWPGVGVVYFQRLSGRRTQSRLNKIMGKPEYRQMTIRNWVTTSTLLGRLDESADET